MGFIFFHFNWYLVILYKTNSYCSQGFIKHECFQDIENRTQRNCPSLLISITLLYIIYVVQTILMIIKDICVYNSSNQQRYSFRHSAWINIKCILSTCNKYSPNTYVIRATKSQFLTCFKTSAVLRYKCMTIHESLLVSNKK